jgi:hypothetical protein
MLDSALEHYRRQQRISAAGLVAARNARNKGSVEIARVVTAFQIVAARDAIASVDGMLDEQGIDDPPVGTPNPLAVAGVASDGRTLTTLFDQATTDYQFGLMVATQLQDAARTAASMGIVARQQVGYVRMLNPPSCSRCAILAGKWFKWNEGFQRHPRCDCRHVPASETNWRGLTTNPSDYFESLPATEQDRIFTKAGAQAIRDGGDPLQIVNARRGMAPAQLFGRDVQITREGITRRGLYGTSQAGSRDGFNVTNKGPRGSVKNYNERTAKRARLMPETIYRVAEDRADAQRLLKLYGYIT